MCKVRIEIVGFGIMAKGHSHYLSKGEVPGAEIVAVCDEIPECFRAVKEVFGEKLAVFETADELFSSVLVQRF